MEEDLFIYHTEQNYRICLLIYFPLKTIHFVFGEIKDYLLGLALED